MKFFFSFSLYSMFFYVLVACPFGAAAAERVRPAVYAGSFYPSDKDDLQKTIRQLTKQAEKTKVDIPANKSLKALIMPHAGYVYSGYTAAHAAHVVEPGMFSRVLLIAPDHRIGFRNGAISNVNAYETPLGKIHLHEDARVLRGNSELFEAIPASDKTEHSLEVLLPFLQTYLGGFALIPIVAGPADTNAISDTVAPLIDNNTLLVVSSDLSHYLPYDQAVQRDQETVREILSRKDEKLTENKNRACGAVPIRIALNLARRFNWQPFLLHYSNSGDSSGDRSRVVGYAAIAFYGDDTMQTPDTTSQNFTSEQGEILVRLARQTIVTRFDESIGKAGIDAIENELQHDDFGRKCGTFVTLKINGQLRGCIGSLTAAESVREGVRRNALNAAFNDYRFKPLRPEELNEIDVEVSVLTDPQPLDYTDATDLLKKLRPSVDGVILRKGGNSATFLPQVWEQLPRTEDFLSHLCRKAGLPLDAWQTDKLEVQTYQVQYFEEH